MQKGSLSKAISLKIEDEKMKFLFLVFLSIPAFAGSDKMEACQGLSDKIDFYRCETQEFICAGSKSAMNCFVKAPPPPMPPEIKKDFEAAKAKQKGKK